MPEMGSARDELLVEARHLTVENGGLSRPATLQIVETSIASSGVRGGRMSGSRRASIVFPPPGAPMSSTLCGRFPTLSDRVVALTKALSAPLELAAGVGAGHASTNISRRATTDATLTDPASIFVPIVSSTFSSPSAHSRGVSLYLRVSVDRTAVARHSEDPSIGGGKSWKRAEVFSVLGLSDQAIHEMVIVACLLIIMAWALLLRVLNLG